MNTEFASSSLTSGQLNAIVKKLGGHDEALKFLRGEISVTKPISLWYEEARIIYFSVTSDGASGEQCIERLRKKGFCVQGYARMALCSPDYKPTIGVTTQVAVLKGVLFRDSERSTENISTKANEFKFAKPNAELAYLIRNKFSDNDIVEMGLNRIVAMHKPIELPNYCGPRLLNASIQEDGMLHGYGVSPGHIWHHLDGFAYICEQIPIPKSYELQFIRA